MSGKIDARDDQERLQEGYSILEAFLKKNAGLPTPELFRQCWKLILRNEGLFRGAATRYNRFNVDGRNAIYIRFALFFRHLRKEFTPPVKLANDSLGFRAPPGSIFLTCHSQIELAIAKLLQVNSHLVAMITAGVEQPLMVELFMLPSVPDYIKRNKDCLLQAREALANSKSLMLVVDYRVFDEAQQQFLYKIGITGFVFAKKMLRPLYFVKLEINADGEIECTVRQSNTEGSADEIAEQFRCFIGGNLSIGDWFSDVGEKLNAVAARPPG